MEHSLQFKVALLVKEINSKINLNITDELKNTRLTISQIMVVKLVAHNQKITVSELSEKMAIKKATVSGILDRLERLDIIERIRSKEDRRVVYIQFSKNGIKLSKEVKDEMNKSFKTVFKNIPQEKLCSIYSMLNYFLDNI